MLYYMGKTILNHKWEDIPDYGLHMTMKEFVKSCLCGSFIDYDGTGYYATATKISDREVRPSDVTRKCVDMQYTHVMWFNR